MIKLVTILAMLLAALNGCSIEQAAIATQPYIEEVVLTLTAHFALTSDGDVLSWGENRPTERLPGRG